MKASSPQSWLPLQPGDIVDLIAPGYKADPKVIAAAAEFLRSWGLVPRIPKNLLGRDLLCANSDERRLEHVARALHASDARAVWCLRGGYGSIRLLPELRKLKKPKHAAKLFIGLSDITSLHVFLNQEWGWPTIHGPLLDRFAKNRVRPRYAREMRDLIFGDLPEIEFKGLKALNPAARQLGKKITAPVSGGNMVVLHSTLATPSEWQTAGRILFFEDIGERGYRIDRILEQYRQAGRFEKAKAVVFGQFTEDLEANGRSLVPAVLKRFALATDIPVLGGLECGHDEIQRPLPLGTMSTLYLGERPRLIVKTGVHEANR